MGVLIDAVLGQGIGDMWVYPRLEGFSKFLHVLIIGYPFALLSISSMYRTVDALIARALREQIVETGNADTRARKSRIAILLTVIFLVALSVPILNWWVLGNRYAHQILVICCTFSIFSISPITYLVFQNSWFNKLVRPEKNALIELVLTWAVASFLHELPNTFAWEWTYQNIPFYFD